VEEANVRYGDQLRQHADQNSVVDSLQQGQQRSLDTLDEHEDVHEHVNGRRMHDLADARTDVVVVAAAVVELQQQRQQLRQRCQ
jgi:hypothetical protein